MPIEMAAETPIEQERLLFHDTWENAFAEPGKGRQAGQLPGLYVHIPFCVRKCRYCDFFSVPRLENIPSFLTALGKEMSLRREVFEFFDTLYIGGGTPSVLNFEQLALLFADLRRNFAIHDEAEITLEANPADLSLSHLEEMRSLGINRLNIGVQSFDEDILNFLGRRHSGEQALQAIDASLKAGFENFGIDLIYGIPGQSRQAWRKTLKQAVSLSIPHLSCYQLTVEPDTPLGKAYRSGAFELPDNEELFDWFMETSEFLEASGYCHYEVSNFSRSDALRSRHNSKYWQHVPYLGLGPAAHSFDGEKRWWNVRNLEAYLRQLEEDQLPVEDCETLTGEALQLESLFLGFRTKAGIDLADFAEKYGCDLWSSKKGQLEPLLNAGHLKIADGRLQPTRTGMALADSLALL